MTAAREAVVLPMLFLTVVLLGAVRPGAQSVLAAPPVGSLVVAMALLALLGRSGVVAPERLMNSTRSALANTNGVVVLLTLFVASAQVITVVVPESGVPALIAWVALVALLAQALAIAPDRIHMLRGLLVTFGAAFALKFVLLAALSAPAEGRVARALQLLFEGVTLGAVSQRPPHDAEGYLAFASVVLYLIGLTMLPSAAWHMVRVTSDRRTLIAEN
jgi:hypothetical protein